jgi:hypothetical protein
MVKLQQAAVHLARDLTDMGLLSCWDSPYSVPTSTLRLAKHVDTPDVTDGHCSATFRRVAGWIPPPPQGAGSASNFFLEGAHSTMTLSKREQPENLSSNLHLSRLRILLGTDRARVVGL